MYAHRSPCVSVVMPVYNVERFVRQAVRSVLDQTYTDLELIIVDDGGSDASVALCETFTDHRIRIVHQANRGLAGARNTGIAEARGAYVALLDSDDTWMPDKLARHVAHLDANPDVGVSYAGAVLIDEHDRPMRLRQRPRLGLVNARHVFCGQVIKNGSIPVFRREVLDAIASCPPGAARPWYFDETLRRSEDVECWIRIALTTPWRFAGIPGQLTRYRINAGGLSADVPRQLESWERVHDTVLSYAPDFIAAHGGEARARELRYLARRAFQGGDRALALTLATRAIRTWPRLIVAEPARTLTTLAACALLRLLPDGPFRKLARAVRAPGHAGATP